ncbi:MAG: STAS domain-containing protein [Lachnospiraceae bacterium]|nr:STAS domain-containing protein [Candidatus Merdinaster equi]
MANLEIQKKTEGTKLIVTVIGRIDSVTAPELESDIKASVENVDNLEIDFEKVEYISSAGLRVLLATQNIMDKRGGMILKNVSEEVMEIFDVTGFSDILTIG